MHPHKVWKNIFIMVAIAFLMVIKNFSLASEILLMKSIKFADDSKPVIDVSELTMVKKNASTHRVTFCTVNSYRDYIENICRDFDVYHQLQDTNFRVLLTQ